MPIAFGIDFGTTNSVLSVNQDSDVVLIDLSPSGPNKKTLKSLLFFDEDRNIYIGDDAITHYIDFGTTHGRFMQSIKAFLPSRSFTETYVYGRRYDISDLIALILKTLKRQGESFTGRPADVLVLGRPVYFSANKEDGLLAEDRLRKAAERAGFTNIHFQYEPIAAALAYQSTMPVDQEQLVLLGDFGGGTSDFTVMRLKRTAQPNCTMQDNLILSLGGVYIGGDIFNSRIMWERIARHFGKDMRYKSATGIWLDMPASIMRDLCQWHKIPLLRNRQTIDFIRNVKNAADTPSHIVNLGTLIVNNLGYELFRSIDTAKCALSQENATLLAFDKMGIHITDNISRSEFNHLIDRDLADIDACITSVLMDAQLQEEHIDMVLLTGGSSFIPRIRELMNRRFRTSRIQQIDPFTSVAYGLSLSTPEC